MRILFCSRYPLARELGGPKVILEVSDAMRALGCACTVVGPAEIGAASGDNPEYGQHLRKYLRAHAGEFDVVEYDHESLPYPRSDFAAGVVFVARSVLLVHHLETIRYPGPGGVRGWLTTALHRRQWAAQQRARIEAATITLREADLVNVSNDDDRRELERRGIAAEKVHVIPYGLTPARLAALGTCATEPPAQPRVAFVGTFDWRKGARDFPAIVTGICRAAPEARFRFVGTRGLHRTAEEVLSFFPKRLRPRIEVIPEFAADALPGILRDCSVGIFPSYVEGFGFGVLEMLAASVPVVAYETPGPPMMLPPQYLVTRGDARAMAQTAAGLLQDRNRLAAARLWAKGRAAEFAWPRFGAQTAEVYGRSAAAARHIEPPRPARCAERVG